MPNDNCSINKQTSLHSRDIVSDDERIFGDLLEKSITPDIKPGNNNKINEQTSLQIQKTTADDERKSISPDVEISTKPKKCNKPSPIERQTEVEPPDPTDNQESLN